MKPTSVPCMEDRVALARRGALSPAEWQEFASHLTVCVDCRVAWRLTSDFEHSAEARPGDERIIARGVKAAMAASAVLVAAGAASAAIVLHVHRSGPPEPPDVPGKVRPAKPRGARGIRPKPLPPVESPAESPAALPVERPAENPLAFPDPRPVENAPALPVERPATLPAERPAERTPALPAEWHAAPPAPDRASSRAAPAASAPESAQVQAAAGPAARPPQEVAELDPFEGTGGSLSSLPASVSRQNAADLFARGLAERQEGHAPAAIATFRRLQRQAPDSPEATVSLVSLGDLLLETRMPVEALAYFQAYLRRAPAGTLALEAWIGKARALDALGRASEARAAWKQIARRFPDARYLRRSGL
jgi:TolA-binding protein